MSSIKNSEVTNMTPFPHPYEPEAHWKIAVSRRFHTETVDRLYYDTIKPVLQEEGIVLECYYASNDIESPDFWPNRMMAIFEISDVHILVTHEPSPAIELEQEWSRNAITLANVPTINTLFGDSPPFDFFVAKNPLFTPVCIFLHATPCEDTYKKGQNYLHLAFEERCRHFKYAVSASKNLERLMKFSVNVLKMDREISPLQQQIVQTMEWSTNWALILKDPEGCRELHNRLHKKYGISSE
jgi:hypothetical protein